MKRISIYTSMVLFLLASAFMACEETEKPEVEPKEYTVSGKVEKGPFISGSTINLQPMDSNLNPTGSSFSTLITDHAGNFSFGTTTLNSPYAQLTANGYFYNEVTGALSSGTLTLRALADLGEQSTVNVNILTHLKYSRIMDLVEKDHKTYAEANKQAQQELLTQFGLQRFADTDAANYSITSGTPEAGALIAISSLILKDRTEAQVTEYLAKLSKEFGETGAFSVETRAIIKNDCKSLTGVLRLIEDNIKARYQELGQEVTVDSLEYFFDWDNDGVAGNEVGSYILSENTFIGTWQSTDGRYYIFNEDNTGAWSSNPDRVLFFNWSLSSRELELQYISSGNSGITAYQSFIIESISESTIDLYDKNDPSKEIVALNLINQADLPWQMDTDPNYRSIKFKINVNQPSTKAYLGSSSDIANNGGFKVWGFKTIGDEHYTVFDGVNIYSDDNGYSWTYSPLRFWDNRASYKFYAAGPVSNSNGTIQFADNTICVNNVHAMRTTDTEVECQVNRGVVETSAGYADPVTFTLSHIMSRVVLKVKKADYCNEPIKIKKLTLKGWNSGNGNFKLNQSLSSSNPGNSEWTIPVYSSGSIDFADENGFTISNNPVVICDYLMIPQSFEADALKLELIFDIVYDDSNEEPYYWYPSLNKDMQATWTTGHKYEYIITIPDLNNCSITISEMSNWDESEAIIVN